MKIFLSWSGNTSHQVAKTFRDWLPSVVQSIVPYVSSEDIDKGARWSTDIAKELEDSTFGILCVTKENINAPWLTFEAGALSKTMDKAFVCPFLFDIKRSEVDGPILQFQSTIFQKEDVKKLLTTINKACDKDKLTDERLEKAFEVWYPQLEQKLDAIKKSSKDADKQEAIKDKSHSSEILEEVLELSRMNQKLLRNPEGALVDSSEKIRNYLEELLNRIERQPEIASSRITRKMMHPMFIEELMHSSPMFKNKFVGLQIILSLFRNDFPWVYDVGKEIIEILKSKKDKSEKARAVEEFTHMLEFTFEHPMMREIYGMHKEYRMVCRELPHLFRRSLEEYL